MSKARDLDGVHSGLLQNSGPTEGLDLGAIALSAADKALLHPALDRRPPFRASATALRWVADLSDSAAEPQLHLSLADAKFRTLQLRCAGTDPEAAARFAEDVARHDWLLTVLARQLERARIGGAGRHAVIAKLRPAVDHLLHLWMPASGCSARLRPLWQALETTPGFSRQWGQLVNRVRDQLALAAAAPER